MINTSPPQSPSPNVSPAKQNQSTPVKSSAGRPNFIHRISAVLSPSRSPPMIPRMPEDGEKHDGEKHDDTVLGNETHLASQLAEAEATITETQQVLKETKDKSKNSTAKLLKQLDDLKMDNERLRNQLKSPKTASGSSITAHISTPLEDNDSSPVENDNSSDGNIDSQLNEALAVDSVDTTPEDGTTHSLDSPAVTDSQPDDAANMQPDVNTQQNVASDVTPLENNSTPAHITDDNDSNTSQDTLDDESSALHDESPPIKYKFDSDYWELSNFRHRSFFIYNKRWKSREHPYQWRKAIFHEKWKIADDILQARTAKHAKFLGSKVNSSPAWNNKKYRIMEGIMMSYGDQVQQYQTALLATGTRLLLEDTPDEFWGSTNGGKNWHGRISMKVRAVLRSKQKHLKTSPNNQAHTPNVQTRKGTNPLAKTFIPGTYSEAVSHGVQRSVFHSGTTPVPPPPPPPVTYGAPLPSDLAKYFQGPIPSAPPQPVTSPPPGASLPPDHMNHFQGPVPQAKTPVSVPAYPASSPHALIFSDSMGKNINFDMEGYKVSVSAHGGGRTGPAIQNLKNEMSSSRHDSITLNYGTNDVMKISPDEFGRTYSALVKQAKSQGASVICSSIFYRGDGRSRHETYEINQAIDEFNYMIRNICQIEHCYYIDNNAGQSAWEPNFGQLRGRMGEKLHLTPVGANHFRDRVQEAVSCVTNHIPAVRPAVVRPAVVRPAEATYSGPAHTPKNSFRGNMFQFSRPPPFNTYNHFEPLSQSQYEYDHGTPHQYYQSASPQFQQSVPSLLSLPLPPQCPPGYPPPRANYRHYM